MNWTSTYVSQLLEKIDERASIKVKCEKLILISKKLQFILPSYCLLQVFIEKFIQMEGRYTILVQ